MKKIESEILTLKEQEEKYNRLLLRLELVIGWLSIIPFLIIIFVVGFFEMELFAIIILTVTAILMFLFGIFCAMKLEREVGYYKCGKCDNKYIPSVLPFWFSMHFGRTRYLKCHNCKKYSWNKKVLTK